MRLCDKTVLVALGAVLVFGVQSPIACAETPKMRFVGILWFSDAQRAAQYLEPFKHDLRDLSTARLLGIKLPQSILMRADEVIP